MYIYVCVCVCVYIYIYIYIYMYIRSGDRILVGTRDVSFFPTLPNRLSPLPNLLFTEYRGSYPGYSGRCVKLTTPSI